MLKHWKRYLITSLLACALVLSVGAPQVNAECYDFTICIFWEDGWECYEYWNCID